MLERSRDDYKEITLALKNLTGLHCSICGAVGQVLNEIELRMSEQMIKGQLSPIFYLSCSDEKACAERTAK
jgi:hypothetical protein